MKSSAIVMAIFLVISTLIGGLYSTSEFDPQEDKTFDAEYLSGVLTASGIVFGLWGIVLQNKPRREEEPIYMTSVEIFLVCFFWLLASIIMIMLSGLGLFSPRVALIFISLTFIVNASFFALSIYVFKYRPIKSQYD